MRRLFLLILVFTAFFCAAPAFAQTHSAGESAESHYQTAVRLFGEGRYVEALQEFDKAIAIAPESIFYCNRAVVLIKLGEPQDALASLEQCQKTFTGSDEELAEIDAQRLGVEAMVAHVRSGAIDTVNQLNAPVVAPPQSQGWTRATTGYLMLGVGAALLASAVTLDRLSVDIRNDFVDASDGRDEGEYEEARTAFVRRQRVWLGLTGGGAAVTLIGGAIIASYYLSGDRRTAVGFSLSSPGLFVRGSW